MIFISREHYYHLLCTLIYNSKVTIIALSFKKEVRTKKKRIIANMVGPMRVI